MYVTKKQIEYLINLIIFYEKISKNEILNYINFKLKEAFPHHYKNITNINDISKFNISYLISFIKEKHSISKILITKNNHFKLELIKSPSSLFSVYNQIFDKSAKLHEMSAKCHKVEIACFPDIMMIDIDSIELPNFPLPYPFDKDNFRIYKTGKGYHLYCTSRRILHTSYHIFKHLENIGCDRKYLSYVYKYGWMVRLSPKKEYHNDQIEVLITNQNYNNLNENPDIIEALDQKDKLIINNRIIEL